MSQLLAEIGLLGKMSHFVDMYVTEGVFPTLRVVTIMVLLSRALYHHCRLHDTNISCA